MPEKELRELVGVARQCLDELAVLLATPLFYYRSLTNRT